MKTELLNLLPGIYSCRLTPKNAKGHILFVHGGPGNHAAYFERAIQELSPYGQMNYGWICYDQRGCGRSDSHPGAIDHQANVNDLVAVIESILAKKPKLNLRAVFAHSYGARVAYEVFRDNANLDLKLILTARSLYNRVIYARYLLMEMLTLKISDPEAYAKALPLLNREAIRSPIVRKKIRQLMSDLSPANISIGEI